MTTRREFLRLVGHGAAGGSLLRAIPVGVGRSLLWRGVPVGLGAAGLSLAVPRRAAAAVVLDPTNPLANFTPEGYEPFTAGSSLGLHDDSNAGLINFFAPDPDAARGRALDVVVRFQVGRTVPNNADTGVRFAINDGEQRAVIAACITKIQRGIGLAAGDNFGDPNNYPDKAFVEVNWRSHLTELRIRRHATGEGEIVSVDGHTFSPRKFLLDTDLASAFRPQPTVEFGCRSNEAEVTVDIHEFRSEVPLRAFASFAARVEIACGPLEHDDRVELKALATLGAGSDGINPSTDLVTLRVGPFTHTIPAGSFRQDRKGRYKYEGIDGMAFLEAVIEDTGGGSFRFKADAQGVELAGIANPVIVELAIGADGGRTEVLAEIVE